MRLARSLLALALGAGLEAQEARRDERGLPQEPAAFRPYAAKADHVANRLFRMLWLRQLQPSEVAATVEAAPMAWTTGWVHRKRDGAIADARWFGGDGRLLPLAGLGPDEASELRALLTKLRAEVTPMAPTLRVLLQHDLLRAAERLVDIEQNLDLVPELLTAARSLSLPATELAALPDPLRLAIAADRELAAAMPRSLGGDDPGLREVLRKSTRLFDAQKSLLWSRVFLAHPDGERALAALLPAARPGQKDGPEVPLGFRAVLVQGIVAIDDQGEARATPLTFDVRTQRLTNRDPLGAANATFTHDGLDFGIWQLEREGVRIGDPARWFRRIAADDHDLFRDYGTAKYTTYRGQCSLCHRLSDTPEPQLAGFVVLRPHAQATFAAAGDERLRLAEREVAKLMVKLAAVR
jgi:hypothetical protein